MKTILLTACALAALASLAPSPAQAQRFSAISGGKLMALCTSRDAKQVEACTAYIDGVSDSVSFYQRLRPSDGSKGGALPAYVCVPGPTTGVQLRQAVVAWAEKHKDQMDRAASGIVLRALDDSFLCQGEQRRVPE